MAQFKNLIGKRIGKLVVKFRTVNIRGARDKLVAQFLCKCDCGSYVVFKASTLIRETPKWHCGCVKSKRVGYDGMQQYWGANVKLLRESMK